MEQRLGNLAKAEKAFRQSLAVAPTYENGFFRLGYVRELRNDFAGAERAYADGLSKNPNSTPLAYRLAIVRSRLSRPTAESDWCDRAREGRGDVPPRLRAVAFR